jgi:glucokinase
VHPDGEACPCGQRGCLERYASAAAITRAYAAAGGPPGTSAADVARRRSTDPAAGRAWDRAVEALAIALASATMLLDPEVVALAGGLSEAGDALIAPLRDALERRVRWRPAPRVVLSPLGARAGLLGAALLARSTAS